MFIRILTDVNPLDRNTSLPHLLKTAQGKRRVVRAARQSEIC